jgi:CBS domain-containing protein
MSQPVVTVAGSETCAAAAARMREADIGFLVVTDAKGAPQGVLTDRDIVVRGVATGSIPSATPVSDVASASPVTLNPGDTLEDAAEAMKRHAVRRLPVTSNERIVGVVSLGDLARRRDPASALGEISTAPPTHV